jgi:hypothetical protein
VLGRGAAVAAAVCCLGCYAYAPVNDMTPEPGRKFAFELNDGGRADLADNIGPSTDRVEGALLGLTDVDYLISVTSVIDDRGQVFRWSGETVHLARLYVRSVRERRFSTPRTAASIGGVALGVVAFAVTRSLGVLGGGGDNPPPPADNTEQSKRANLLPARWP